MRTTLRKWEYYGLTDTFTELYNKSKSGEIFSRLYDLIVDEKNILLAYRTIKNNKGSETAGTDEIIIDNYKSMTKDDFIKLVRKTLVNYKPKPVRRVFIPKPNGDKRPLGIPTMLDRLLQQMFKQILEPIAEAKFHKHSYGFRPIRSTHHAISRCNFLIWKNGLHYVVDVDIRGFFDNVNHTKLLKQLWNLGIRDRKVLAVINKMLKAPIDKEGVPLKGTPQGGILSPLLANIVLHDLDMWVASQWEEHPTKYSYSATNHKYHALKKTNLKEGFIVRYADDFKIFTRDWKSAYKWFHAVKQYLKMRLGLDISPEKSKVINLRKKATEFLGYTIKAVRNRNIHTSRSSIKKKKIEAIKKQAKNLLLVIRKSPIRDNITKWNSFVLGIHNYFKHASMVSHVFARIAYDLQTLMYNRLNSIGKFKKPSNAPPSYKKFFGANNYKTWIIDGEILYPLADISFSKAMNFTQEMTPYTIQGRNLIHTKLQPSVRVEINKLLNSYKGNDYSIEYMDNRISRYSMKMGKCEITGLFLTAEEVHCHHYIPKELDGTDEFKNLRIIHKDIHVLIHALNKKTINKIIKHFKLTEAQINKINQYRRACNLEAI